MQISDFASKALLENAETSKAPGWEFRSADLAPCGRGTAWTALQPDFNGCTKIIPQARIWSIELHISMHACVWT